MLKIKNRFGSKNIFGEQNVHVVFELSLLLKAILALMEIFAGVLTYFVTPQFLLNMLHRIKQVDLMESRGDVIANYLLHTAQHLSISSLHFAALYLLVHGAIKLWIIIGLWRKKQGYYPIAIVIFSLFIVYQLYRYTFTHSPLLILITILDVLVIVLTLLEYRRLKRANQQKYAPDQ